MQLVTRPLRTGTEPRNAAAAGLPPQEPVRTPAPAQPGPPPRPRAPCRRSLPRALAVPPGRAPAGARPRVARWVPALRSVGPGGRACHPFAGFALRACIGISPPPRPSLSPLFVLWPLPALVAAACVSPRAGFPLPAIPAACALRPWGGAPARRCVRLLGRGGVAGGLIPGAPPATPPRPRRRRCPPPSPPCSGWPRGRLHTPPKPTHSGSGGGHRPNPGRPVAPPSRAVVSGASVGCAGGAARAPK